MTSSPWTGMLPVDDTALAVTDTGGSATPVVYLNGAYASQRHWRRVIADLGSGYRHITYDERARGRSTRSADYSFEACLRDLDAVLAARGVDRPLLVGWSYGGILSWHWADRNPDRVLGVVTVDAFPVGLTGAAGRERIRKEFRQVRLLLPIASRLGLGARMSADQHAEVNIELNEIGDASKPVLRTHHLPTAVRPGHRSKPRQPGRRDGTGTRRTRPDPRPQRQPRDQREGRERATTARSCARTPPPSPERYANSRPPIPEQQAEPMAAGLTIGQAAAFAGVTITTVRHYHRLGLLDEPRRDTSGYRRYTSTDLLRLVQVRTRVDAGVPLAEVGELLDADPERFAAAVVDVERRLTDRSTSSSSAARRCAGWPTAIRRCCPIAAAPSWTGWPSSALAPMSWPRNGRSWSWPARWPRSSSTAS